MIADKIDYALDYASINSNLKIGLEFLKNNDLSILDIGKFEIKGSDVFGIVSEYTTKNLEDAKWETHYKYIDIQYLISGTEKIGFAPMHGMPVVTEYNPEKDIRFHVGSGDYVTIGNGVFAVFFPQDAHQPCVAIGEQKQVRKIVIKVKA